jgi:hypothetical protein
VVRQRSAKPSSTGSNPVAASTLYILKGLPAHAAAGLYVFCLSSRLLKNAHLLRCAHHASLRRTQKYASFHMVSRALHLSIFEQPVLCGLFQWSARACLPAPQAFPLLEQLIKYLQLKIKAIVG